MRKLLKITWILVVLSMLIACNSTNDGVQEAFLSDLNMDDAVKIQLNNDEIKVNGESVGNDNTQAVYTANDIVYYEEGHDFTYGEGSDEDAHSAEEAEAHTVVHITQPGVYSLSGTLSKGQIAVDLGEDAEEDPEAVVTLILNGVDITCEVAPAVIFYNVYECGNTDTETATKDVDTSNAGANVVIADGTTNTVNGSYVARIYKPDSVVLSEDGTEVEEAKKLHKYDGAFYSKMSMNITGGLENTGILNINAENEGLDSELHLTINGGNINITSGNDGINTNEDYVSVTTINCGTITISVNGSTGEGDGIDSNGWLVINGGTVIAAACSDSADAGIDSDMGIYINGGTVMASGHMLDRIEDGGQNYAVFNFAGLQDGKGTITLKDESNETVATYNMSNSYSILVFSSPELKPGTYTLWNNDIQFASSSNGVMMGGFGGGGMMPGGEQRPEEEAPQLPENMELPDGMNPDEMTPPEKPEGMEFSEMEAFSNMPEGEGFPNVGEGEMPDDMQRPEGMEMPTNDQQPSMGMQGAMNQGGIAELSTEFVISEGGNMFGNVIAAE